MKNVAQKVLAILGAGLGFFLGLAIADSNSNDLDAKLKKELGDRFQEKNIQEIYVAGPNRTHFCH